jgi:single-strand selective monofunctional uracil DNA glycosylase
MVGEKPVFATGDHVGMEQGRAMTADIMDSIVDGLLTRLSSLAFSPPVAYVYNPLIYAREPYRRYVERYGTGPKEAVLLGMNPGPWGMAQTGVPFGDVGLVKGWLEIEGKVERPPLQHPKRAILGFRCPRGEVSGQRLWGWARDRFGSPAAFFRRFWVGNYCPLVFMEQSGRNRTPDRLNRCDKTALFEACDEALKRTISWIRPRYVIGVGNFAYQRATAALAGQDVRFGRITHPSPANPKANRGWADLVERELGELGLLP